MCIEAANYIIKKTNDFNKKNAYSKQISLTCKRLQKLLYFSDIKYMQTHDGKSMFSDEFHAWPSGPVIPSVYHQFMQYQNGEMKPLEDGYHTPITKDMESAIDSILKETNNMDTQDLVLFSHIGGGPWAKAYNINDPDHKQVISKEEMSIFYRKNPIFNNV